MRRFFHSLFLALVSLILILIILFTLTILVTHLKPDLNNSLHQRWSFWPRLNTTEKKTVALNVHKSDFGEIKSQFIQIKAQSPELLVSDGPTSNPLSITAEYYRLSDEPVLTTNLDDKAQLNVLLDRPRNMVDLPPTVYPIPKWDIKLGNMDVPTDLIIKTLSGKVDVTFTKKPLQSLNIESQSADVSVTFSQEALPQKSIVLSSEDGDFSLILPTQEYSLHYFLGREAKLKIGVEEIRGGKGDYGLADPKVLQIEVRVEEGDVEIAIDRSWQRSDL